MEAPNQTITLVPATSRPDAAIEAAHRAKRAGLSVVARDVRNLARRSSEAARESAYSGSGERGQQTDAGVRIHSETRASVAELEKNGNGIVGLIAEYRRRPRADRRRGAGCIWPAAGNRSLSQSTAVAMPLGRERIVQRFTGAVDAMSTSWDDITVLIAGEARQEARSTHIILETSRNTTFAASVIPCAVARALFR